MRALALLLAAAPLLAQSGPPADPPSVAYAYALQPVTIVKSSRSNVTDAELYAWTIAVKRSAAECAARSFDDYSGAELLAFGKMCALGKNYQATNAAVKKYLADPNAAAPGLARVLWARAALAQGDGTSAQRAAELIIDTDPYDAVAHTVVQEVIDALAGPDEGAALALALRRFPLLLKALAAGTPLVANDNSGQVDTATLFRDGLKLASLYKLRGDDKAGSSVLQQLAAQLQPVGDKIDPVQHRAIDVAVKRYLMLGTTSSDLSYYRRVPKSGSAAQPPRYVIARLRRDQRATVLFFFTSWCPQCLKTLPSLPGLPKQYKGKVSVWAVTTPEVLAADTLKPMDAEKFLATNLKDATRGVPILLLADDSRAALNVDEYPMVAILDRAGTIRYLDLLPSDRLEQGGYLDRLLKRILGEP